MSEENKIHHCEERLVTEDHHCVTISRFEGTWYFNGFECTGAFEILHCPFCGKKLEDLNAGSN